MYIVLWTPATVHHNQPKITHLVFFFCLVVVVAVVVCLGRVKFTPVLQGNFTGIRIGFVPLPVKQLKLKQLQISVLYIQDKKIYKPQ